MYCTSSSSSSNMSSSSNTSSSHSDELKYTDVQKRERVSAMMTSCSMNVPSSSSSSSSSNSRLSPNTQHRGVSWGTTTDRLVPSSENQQQYYSVMHLNDDESSIFTTSSSYAASSSMSVNSELSSVNRRMPLLTDQARFLLTPSPTQENAIIACEDDTSISVSTLGTGIQSRISRHHVNQEFNSDDELAGLFVSLSLKKDDEHSDDEETYQDEKSNGVAAFSKEIFKTLDAALVSLDDIDHESSGDQTICDDFAFVDEPNLVDELLETPTENSHEVISIKSSVYELSDTDLGFKVDGPSKSFNEVGDISKNVGQTAKMEKESGDHKYVTPKKCVDHAKELINSPNPCSTGYDTPTPLRSNFTASNLLHSSERTVRVYPSNLHSKCDQFPSSHHLENESVGVAVKRINFDCEDFYDIESSPGVLPVDDSVMSRNSSSLSIPYGFTCTKLSPRLEALVRMHQNHDDDHAYDILVKFRRDINNQSHVCVVDVIRSSMIMSCVIFGSHSYDTVYLFKFGGSLSLCFLSTFADAPTHSKESFSFHCLPLTYVKEVLISRKALLLFIYVVCWIEICNAIDEIFDDIDLTNVLNRRGVALPKGGHRSRLLTISLLFIALKCGFQRGSTKEVAVSR